MGSCASVYRNSETDMKLRLSFGSKTERLGIPPSPVKENHINGGNNFRIDDIALKSQRSPSRSTTNFRDYGMVLFLESLNQSYFIWLIIYFIAGLYILFLLIYFSLEWTLHFNECFWMGFLLSSDLKCCGVFLRLCLCHYTC